MLIVCYNLYSRNNESTVLKLIAHAFGRPRDVFFDLAVVTLLVCHLFELFVSHEPQVFGHFAQRSQLLLFLLPLLEHLRKFHVFSQLVLLPLTQSAFGLSK